jgi:cysteinyl-tRNA synthetase
MTELKLYNTLTRSKEVFTPIDRNNVRLYACGPTVYDFAHIGNARPVIVFDVLFRLLRHLYGKDHVTYVRNITDVDDKINKRALRDFPNLPLNEAIARVTAKTADQFHEDVKALGCLEPTHEPRATEHIDGMIRIIQQLLKSGHAYVAQGEEGREALFDVRAMPEYGQLSRRKIDDQQAGARVAVEAHKRNPEDFVLWKESAPNEPGWSAVYEISDANRNDLRLNTNTVSIFGRPGWHIECSAMSNTLLWENLKGNLSENGLKHPHQFDIHAGGLDLIFPHHENEIAQSCCAFETKTMANVWMHNGFLQVEGRKMSKSEGNFVTIHELLNGIGRAPVPGEVIRLTMLATHYRQPIDFSEAKLNEWRLKLERWVEAFRNNADEEFIGNLSYPRRSPFIPSNEVVEALSDDLNFQLVIVHLDSLAQTAHHDSKSANELGTNLIWLGLMRGYLSLAYFNSTGYSVRPDLYDKYRHRLVDARALTLNRYEWPSNLEVRTASREQLNREFETRFPELRADGVSIRLREHGDVSLMPFEANAESNTSEIESKINERLAFLAAKNFTEADRIRDELLAQGIQLKDSKDSVTGERVTGWEVKR